MPERPVECSHCKKAVKVVYKEIAHDTIIVSEMCADCPVLQQKLHGDAYASATPLSKIEGEAGLCCGNCRTSLESMKMGGALGCSECYAVFSDLLLAELNASDAIAPRAKGALAAKKGQPIHIGKSPKLPVEIGASSRLTALNEALNEALKKENYEQAAWLRDQIKAIREKPDEGKS